MSEVTIRICDVKGCRTEAVSHLDVILVCRQEVLSNGHGGSYKIYAEKDVDLCGNHDWEYRKALPDTVIEKKEK